MLFLLTTVFFSGMHNQRAEAAQCLHATKTNLRKWNFRHDHTHQFVNLRWLYFENTWWITCAQKGVRGFIFWQGIASSETVFWHGMQEDSGEQETSLLVGAIARKPSSIGVRVFGISSSVSSFFRTITAPLSSTSWLTLSLLFVVWLMSVKLPRLSWRSKELCFTIEDVSESDHDSLNPSE